MKNQPPKETSSNGRPPAPQPKPSKAGSGRSNTAAASRLKRRAGQSSKDQALDHLVGSFSREGRLSERFLRSSRGKAALRLLGQQSDSAVSKQLRGRGLSDKQISTLRQDLFVHLQRQVGRCINDGIKDTRMVVARMVRDPGVRRGFIDHLAGLKDRAARTRALQGLGIEAGTAATLARTPRCPDAALTGALKTADADLQRLWTQATMTKQDPIRAAGTFELFGAQVGKVRHDMGLPAGNGSFGSKALDAGVKAAHKSHAKQETYGKLSNIAASVLATVATGGSYGLVAAAALGATSSATTAAVSGLPGLAKARHRRKLAETGEALGLARQGTAERARSDERTVQQQYGASIGASVVTGTAGSAAASTIPTAAAGGLAAPAVSAAGAGSAETASQVVLPKIVK